MSQQNGVTTTIPTTRLDKTVDPVPVQKTEAAVKDVHTLAAEAARFASDEAVLTSIADRDRANAQTQLAGIQQQLAEEQLKQLRQPVPMERNTVINLTVNVPAPQVIQMSAPTYPALPERRYRNVDVATVGILALFLALGAWAFAAYGLRDGWFQPISAATSPAPIVVSGQTARISGGMVDISAVAENDRGIRSRRDGLYELFQLSTDYTISKYGTAILANSAGDPIFHQSASLP